MVPLHFLLLAQRQAYRRDDLSHPSKCFACVASKMEKDSQWLPFPAAECPLLVILMRPMVTDGHRSSSVFAKSIDRSNVESKGVHLQENDKCYMDGGNQDDSRAIGRPKKPKLYQIQILYLKVAEQMMVFPSSDQNSSPRINCHLIQ